MKFKPQRKRTQLELRHQIIADLEKEESVVISGKHLTIVFGDVDPVSWAERAHLSLEFEKDDLGLRWATFTKKVTDELPDQSFVDEA
jgi:hypothetical protein